MRVLRSRVVALAGACGGLIACWALFAGAARASTVNQATTPLYYLALGDSLSTGGGATAGHGYVDDIFNWATRSIPGLTLENLGCAGDTTTRMIHGGGCTNYQTGNQLGDAEQFLAAHKGQVAFVTIDIGGDDVVGCGAVYATDPSCLQPVLNHVATNMQTILSGLRNAGGNLPIVGMLYYDPVLGDYLNGSAGQTQALESIGALIQFNRELRSLYRSYGVKIANAQKEFESFDLSPTGSFDGQVLPQNVANICNWTHMCQADPNIHTNDFGHELLAVEFEYKLERIVTGLG